MTDDDTAATTAPAWRPPYLKHPGKLIMCIGLPGSGKSTWTAEQLAHRQARDERNVVHLSRDRIRALLYGPGNWHGWNELAVSQHMKVAMRSALFGGCTVFNDDTNLVARHRQKLTGFAAEYNAEVIVNDSFLRVPVEECIARDATRPEPVGAETILGLWEMYLAEAGAPC